MDFESSARRKNVSTFDSSQQRVSIRCLRGTYQYRPPLVGMALPRSAMASPTTKMQPLARNQPQTNPTGPAGMEKDRVLAIEGSKPMIENAIPKTSIMLKLRRSSCLYLK